MTVGIQPTLPPRSPPAAHLTSPPPFHFLLTDARSPPTLTLYAGAGHPSADSPSLAAVLTAARLPDPSLTGVDREGRSSVWSSVVTACCQSHCLGSQGVKSTSTFTCRIVRFTVLTYLLPPTAARPLYESTTLTTQSYPWPDLHNTSRTYSAERVEVQSTS